MRLYVKAHCFTSDDMSFFGTYMVKIELTPKGETQECECHSNPVTCFKIFKFDCEDQYEAKGTIEISFIACKSFGRKKVLGKLSLPFDNFDIDTTTRHVFDMEDSTIRADIEVHISTDDNKRAFLAPAGKYKSLPDVEAEPPVPAPNNSNDNYNYDHKDDGVLIDGQIQNFPGESGYFIPKAAPKEEKQPETEDQQQIPPVENPYAADTTQSTQYQQPTEPWGGNTGNANPYA